MEYKKYYKNLFYSRIHKKRMKWRYFNCLININKLVIGASKEGRRLTVGAISEAIGRSYRHTLRMVYELARAGFVAILRGRNGGVVSNGGLIYKDYLRIEKYMTDGVSIPLTDRFDVNIDTSNRHFAFKKQVFLSNSREKVENFRILDNLKVGEVSLLIENTFFNRLCEDFRFTEKELEMILKQFIYFLNKLSITEIPHEKDISEFLIKYLKNHRKDVFLLDYNTIESDTLDCDIDKTGYLVLRNERVNGVYIYIKKSIVDGWCGRYGYRNEDMVHCLKRFIFWLKKCLRFKIRNGVEIIGLLVKFIKNDFILQGRKEDLYRDYCKHSGFQIRVGKSKEDLEWFGNWFKETYNRRGREYFPLYYTNDGSSDKFVILPKGLRGWCYDRGFDKGSYGKLQSEFVRWIFEKMEFIPGVDKNLFGLFVKFANNYLEKNDISPFVRMITGGLKSSIINDRKKILDVKVKNGLVYSNKKEREKNYKEYKEKISNIPSIGALMFG